MSLSINCKILTCQQPLISYHERMIKKIFPFAFIVLFSLEAFVSGVQSVSGVSGFVFAEVRVGLKVQGPGPDDGGYQENKRRMAEAGEKSKSVALKIQKSLEEFKKNHKELHFLPIEKSYEIFDKSMSGYQKFPTLISDEEAQKAIATSCYFQLSANPRVIVRFKSLPKLETINDLKKRVSGLVADVD